MFFFLFKFFLKPPQLGHQHEIIHSTEFKVLPCVCVHSCIWPILVHYRFPKHTKHSLLF